MPANSNHEIYEYIMRSIYRSLLLICILVMVIVVVLVILVIVVVLVILVVMVVLVIVVVMVCVDRVNNYSFIVIST